MSIMNKFLNKTKHMCLYASVGLFIGIMLNGYICQTVKVTGSSMEPTFHDGTKLLMEKISYRFHTPNRFDIIVFPQKDNYFLIKRIIGLPNETIFINSMGEIFVNGQLLKENFGKEKILNAGMAEESITLGENEYFVLGDNRNASMDSRNECIGNVRLEDITGKIMR